MAKRIVNKAERNAERYDAKETGYQLYEGSLKGNKFDRLMPLIVSEQNIILAYRNICKNNGSKTPGTDGKTITEIQSLPIETVIKTVRNKLNFYQPKKVRRVEIPKDNGKTRPLGIPSIWDRLIQQCILQILEPICEAKFHERNNGFRPYRSTQNAIAQCYKMAQLQNLHFVVNVNLRHGAVDVRRLPMEQAVTFTGQIRSAGRQKMRLPGRCFHVNGYHQSQTFHSEIYR